LEKKVKEKGFKPLWETKMIIWQRAAAGDSEDAILDHLSKQENFNVEDRYTVRKIKKSFSSLERADLDRALSSDPSLTKILEDERILAEMAELVDRDVFRTPLQLETTLIDFYDGITETIYDLKRGFTFTANGKMKLSIKDLHDPLNKSTLDQIIDTLSQIRDKCEYYRRTRDIELYESDNIYTQIVNMTEHANLEIHNLRKKVLDDFRKIYSPFKIDLQYLPIIKPNNSNRGHLGFFLKV
jgi:hypothetical protein